MGVKSKRALKQIDGVALGVHLSFFCPEIIEFCGLLGFEWLLLDAEHGPLNHHLCRDLVRAADGAGLSCVVRVPEIKGSVIEGFLEAGVMGIMAPNVSSASDARELVAAVKFFPEGERGSASKVRAADYGLVDSPAEYYRRANQTVFTVALVENQMGMENLESIAAVPGIDYIILGPNDLGFSMGTDKGLADPRVRQVIQDAETRVRAGGKSLVAIVSDSAQAKRAVESGAKLVAVSDFALLASAGRSFLGEVKS